MKSNGHEKRRAVDSRVPDDGLEQLRAAFFERLKSERLRLLNLRVALAHGGDRGQVLDELRTRAHRLSGTAAIFELAALAALARALELAVEGVIEANGAILPPGENSDRAMCVALHALVRVIADLVEPTPVPQLHRRKAAPRAKAMLNG
jgi:HPt (histidine-containing phosphotransfer) domain-containing protein